MAYSGMAVFLGATGYCGRRHHPCTTVKSFSKFVQLGMRHMIVFVVTRSIPASSGLLRTQPWCCGVCMHVAGLQTHFCGSQTCCESSYRHERVYNECVTA